MPYMPKALIACCESGDRQVLVNLVARCGLKPMIATSTGDAISRLRKETSCIAFCSYSEVSALATAMLHSLSPLTVQLDSAKARVA